MDRRDWFWLSAMGRLNRDWTAERAAEHMRALSPGLLEATLPSGRDAVGLEQYRRFRLTVVPAANGVSELRAAYGTALWVLLAMTGLVLLMACVNLMNLLLARASAREQEIAVRVAIGASRRRVTLQLLTESLLLAVGGAVLGAATARPLSGGILALLTTEGNPLHLDLRPDRLVLGFTAAAGMLTCIAFGVVPALRASHVQPGTAMKAGGRGLVGSRERTRLQRGLVVAQVAVVVRPHRRCRAVRAELQEPDHIRHGLQAGGGHLRSRRRLQRSAGARARLRRAERIARPHSIGSTGGLGGDDDQGPARQQQLDDGLCAAGVG